MSAILPLYFLGFGFYCAYWCEIFNCKAYRYLGNIKSRDEFSKYVSLLQAADPKVTFTIQNWHQEARTSKDSNGNTTTTYVRVNSLRAEMEYRIAGHTDETMSLAEKISMLHLPNQSGSVKGDYDAEKGNDGKDVVDENKVLIWTCHFPIHFFPRDEITKQAHLAGREQFYTDNTRDVNQDKMESHTVKGHQEFVLVAFRTGGSGNTQAPFWMQQWVFLLCCFFFVGIIYRKVLYMKTQKITWDVTKHFSALPRSEWKGEPISSLKICDDPSLRKVANDGEQDPNMAYPLPAILEAVQHGDKVHNVANHGEQNSDKVHNVANHGEENPNMEWEENPNMELEQNPNMAYEQNPEMSADSHRHPLAPTDTYYA
jgi:hypothetical protein